MLSRYDNAKVTHAIGRYRQSNLRKSIVLAAIFLLLLLAMMLAIGLGTAGEGLMANWRAFFSALSHRLHGEEWQALGSTEQIIWELRFPRVLTAVTAGVGLAVAGLMMQAILRNPLGSPFTLGIASAASFGAALVIILQGNILAFLAVGIASDISIIINAFIFALGAMSAIYGLSYFKRAAPETIILLGIAMMFLFDAATALVQYLGRPEEVAQLAYWLFGSLTKASWEKFAVMSVFVIATIAISYRWVWDFNAIMIDDETAASVGTNVRRLRLSSLILASLMTAVIVSMLGPIAFVGLVAPHIARLMIGSDHRFLFPGAGLLGAIMLTVADVVSRTIQDPIVIPVGILTSFIGVPVLLYLIMRGKKSHL